MLVKEYNHLNPLHFMKKLRQSLVLGESETYGGFDDPMDGNEDHEFENDLPDFEQAENIYMDAEVRLPHEKHNDDSTSFDCNGAFGQEDPNSQASLEDLCRSHLVKTCFLGYFLHSFYVHYTICHYVLLWKPLIRVST
ncbi:condensin-2 complex subunit H2-like [Magnolia sinica]|uniref:condensin-2 complex subunit H2-like n=1 Tax=Magnolia sinica TaxID=86752 RepID=UPI002658A33E|nr:condensin-2 complex subunit H2-like [Magnolia sinica]